VRQIDPPLHKSFADITDDIGSFAKPDKLERIFFAGALRYPKISMLIRADRAGRPKITVNAEIFERSIA